MSLFETHEHDPMRVVRNYNPAAVGSKQRKILEEIERKLARRGDPSTSKEAARAVAASMPESMVYALSWLTSFPGSTAAELDEMSTLRGGAIRKRLNDLRRVGLAKTDGIRKCKITGRRAQTWQPTT